MDKEIGHYPEEAYDTKSTEHSRYSKWWLKRLFQQYDGSVLVCLFISYFMIGFREFQMLAVRDYCKHYLELEPDQTQTLVSFVVLPWAFKVLYGLLADNLPLCGSRRKAYLILSGAVACASMMCMVPGTIKDAKQVTLILAIHSAAIAYFEVVVDALMIV